jgi:hypothetical protein
LVDAEPKYVMTLEVTDGCLSSTADLTIRVRLPPNEGKQQIMMHDFMTLHFGLARNL